MSQPWIVLDSVDTDDGRVELRRRGVSDFVITVAGRILMNSHSSRSEVALGAVAAEAALSASTAPYMLIGGLGMAYTLRAALDALPAEASVVVAELTPKIVEWCAGPLATLTDSSVEEERVRIEIRDVTAVIRDAANGGKRFDAIALDLYEGPHEGRGAKFDPVFGDAALKTTLRALTKAGTFALWTEHRDTQFEHRLKSCGFDFEIQRPGKGGLRHAVYIARARKR
jgi:spermidine synthase